MIDEFKSIPGVSPSPEPSMLLTKILMLASHCPLLSHYPLQCRLSTYVYYLYYLHRTEMPNFLIGVFLFRMPRPTRTPYTYTYLLLTIGLNIEALQKRNTVRRKYNLSV